MSKGEKVIEFDELKRVLSHDFEGTIVNQYDSLRNS